MKSNIFSQLDGSGLHVAIIAARFNQELTDAMLADCLDALRSSGLKDDDTSIWRVPGSFELPIAAAKAAKSGKFDAVICLGVIIKGDTRHDHYIAESVANSLQRLALDYLTPVIFGVLTTENREQAEARSLGGHKKGWEAGLSAIEVVRALKDR